MEGLEDRRLLTFVPAVVYPTGTNPVAMVAADFNNDGVQDLAAANPVSNDVSVLLGNSDGTFQPALTSETGDNPLSLAVGDFNDDGILDLATANSLNSDVSVLLGIESAENPGQGTGNFAVLANIDIGSEPTSVAVGDFTGDGKLDLGVTSNIYHPGYFDPSLGYYVYGYNEGLASVLEGDNEGNFSGPNSTSLPYSYLTAAIAANLDGSGAAELVAVHYDYYSNYGNYNGKPVILVSDGTGHLQPSAFPYTGAETVRVAAGDVNGDDAPDLVTANGYYGSVSVLLNDGSGGFGSAENYPVGGYASAVVIGDFNQDSGGEPDILVTSGSDLGVLYGRASGTFSPAVTAAAGLGAYALAAGDFNGDDWPDAAALTNSPVNTISVLLNDQEWPPPPATLKIGDVTVSEGDSGTVQAEFTVTREESLGSTVTVNFSTAGGGATSGNDFVAVPTGTLNFGPNETEKTIMILVNGDGIDEFDEVFHVNLFAPIGAIIIDGQGAGTILDDDAPPEISISDQARKEGSRLNTSFIFTVTLSEVSGKGVYVNFATADGTALVDEDYIFASGFVYLAPGQTTRTLTVTVRADKTPEFDETFVVKLTAATDGGAGVGGTIVDDEGVGTIINDDRGGGKGKGNKGGSAGLIAALLAEEELATARKRK